MMIWKWDSGRLISLLKIKSWLRLRPWRLTDSHLAQALNYLEVLNLESGLLINFGSKSLEVKRLINNKCKQSFQSNQSV